MCQPLPTGLYTRWDFDSETSRLIPRQNKTRSFENMVTSFFQSTRPDCKIESFFTTGRQKKIDCFSVDGFCFHCNTVFEAMGCFYHLCPCQELRPFLTEEEIQENNTIKESLAFLKKSSDVRRCYVYAVRHTAAMTSPLIDLNSAVKVLTNAYWNRAGTDHWKSIGES